MHLATENEYVSIIELLVETNVFEWMKHESTLIHTALRWGAEIGAGFFEPLRTRTKSLDEADDSHKASTSWAVSLRQS